MKLSLLALLLVSVSSATETVPARSADRILGEATARGEARARDTARGNGDLPKNFILSEHIITEHGPPCQSSDDCDAGTEYCRRVMHDQSTWTCEKKLENGRKCDVMHPEYCASGRCNAEGFCQALRFVGEECDTGADCVSDRCKSGNDLVAVCVEKLKLGDKCSYDKQCETGICEGEYPKSFCVAMA